jgi:tetratricopeptide (TPR) repeat protein
VRAAERLASAGRRSLATGDGGGAANLLGRAAALAEPGGRDGVELLLELARALADSGDLRGARRRLEEGVELASSLDDRALELRAACELSNLRVTVDSSFTAEEALELGREAVAELEQLGDHAALSAAWNLVASGENLRGTWTGVTMALERVADHARLAGDRRREVQTMHLLGPCFFWGPMQVSEGVRRVQAIAEDRAADTLLQAWSNAPLIGFYGMMGRFDEARALVEHTRSILAELGRTMDLCTLAFWSAREAGAACEGLEAAGEQGWLSTMAAMLANALCAQGKLDEAAAAARRSRETATSDDFNAQSLWRGSQARILARRGQFEEAEQLARESIELIDQSDELSHQADQRVGLAEVLRLAGRTEEAIPVLRDALDRYERKENDVSAAATRTLLSDLSA